MRRSNEKTISALVAEYIKEQGLTEGLLKGRIYAAYSKTVGKIASGATSGMFYKEKILYCTITSSIVRHNLNQMRESIVSRINEEVGANVVEQIVLR